MITDGYNAIPKLHFFVGARVDPELANSHIIHKFGNDYHIA